MQNFFGLQLDRLSFWIGFLTGTLFWFVLSRLSKEWPAIREGLKQWFKHLRQRQLAGTEFAIRQDALRRAQRSHLSAALFSLDEIVIPPRLLAPPPLPLEEADSRLPYVYEQIFPPLPEWPEFASRYGAPRLTPLQALAQQARVAILGKPGSGKTVTLAFLASLLARRETDLEYANNLTPVFLHYLDIEPFLPDTKDPLEPIYKALSRILPLSAQPRLWSFLKSAFGDGNIALLLDGVDEIPPEMLGTATSYLRSLLERYPHVRLMLAASDQYLDGLLGLGIEPLFLAAWTRDQTAEFIARWSRLWNQQIGSQISQKTGLVPLDDLLVRGWVDPTPVYSPLEWTLYLWALLAGDLSNTIPRAIDAYVNRLCGPKIPTASLITLARTFIESRKPALTIREIEQSVTELQSLALTSPEEEPSIDEKPLAASTSKTMRPANRILLALLDTGLLSEYSGERLAFNHVYVMAYLAAQQSTAPPIEPSRPLWSAEDALCYHFITTHTGTNWLESWVDTASSSSKTFFLHAFYWVRLAPRNSAARSFLMKRLLPILQGESEDPESPMEGLAACVTANDPSLSLLFRQWLKATRADLRLYGTVGCGFLQDPAALKELIALLNDPEEKVRVGACFGLAQYRDPMAEEAILRALMFGDEMLRLAAAEVLANVIPGGEEHLKEALTLEDLLTRRAAVLGIAHLDAPWVIGELERMAVEDGQWVVRNAAAQALESRRHADARFPHKSMPPHETPWLIAFAAKRGQGISPGQPVDALLQQALVQGDDQEKLAAMLMVRSQPHPAYTQALKTLLHHENPEVRHMARYTLRVLSLYSAETSLG
ncbi:HEAT repeat domain-containing protein [uncultured Thermanaerothrix sp.]|uniref:HEAT repeat domain-containing protein n=1 Tax=uncultured Thermanaerothrix sp. TaxID=1195149 RepID=UPI00260E4452|nr:HEAT repeat domain-containing protein [uncultured Thermanaerothrix sp.]